MAVYEVDPISRIEGHLGVKLNVTDGYVDEADVHGNLWRGFENFLIGREINDAITFTQRICGVCPVPHGQASTFAADAVLGYNSDFQTWVSRDDDSTAKWCGADGRTPALTPEREGIPAKAVLIRNLVLSAEFLMSHITHSYHLAAPSYIQGPNIPPWTPYFNDTFYHPYLLSEGKGVDATATDDADTRTGSTLPRDKAGFSDTLWSAVIKQYVKALRIRRLTFEAGALFAGRMPMTSCYVAGGVTTDKDEALGAKCDMYRSMMEEIGTFIVKEFVPLFLALGALYPQYDNAANAGVLAAVHPDLWKAGAPAKITVATETLGVAGGAAVLGAGTRLIIPNSVTIDGSTDGFTVNHATGAVSGLTLADGDYDASYSYGKAGFGAGCGNFLAWGAFPQLNGVLGFARGFIAAGDEASVGITAADVGTQTAGNYLAEYIGYSRYEGSVTRLNADGSPDIITGTTKTYPGTQLRTIPERNTSTKYSWLKAPRWNNQPAEVGPMARMFVAGFFKKDTALRTSLGAHYTNYVVFSGTTPLGLDPAMVEPDLAVALVRAGLAVLMSGGTTTVDAAYLLDNATDSPAGKTAIVNAYNAAGSYITGPVYNWILNLSAGYSTMDRLRARPLESLVLIQSMIGTFTKGATGVSALAWNGGGWIGDLKALPAGRASYIQKAPSGVVEWGFGATEAPRGALMHMAKVDGGGKILSYQCIVPTTWNASPKGASETDLGPMEKAMIGIPYSDAKTTTKGGAGKPITAGGGVEALRVAQSFDPCIACAIH